LITITCLRVDHIENRHAVDRRGFVGLGNRIHHVVGADHDGDIGGLELGVDVIHVDDQVVGHAGFGQQHVHVTRHAARDWMDRELHVLVARDQLFAQLPDLVLRLRHRHAVARHDDDACRPCTASRSGIRRLDRLHRARDRLALPPPPPKLENSTPVIGPIHRLGHQLGQQHARRTHHHAGDDQRLVAQHVAFERHREAGEGVVKRDHHRHVGTADRQRHQHADQQRQHEESDHHIDAQVEHQPRAERDRGEEERRLTNCWPAKVKRLSMRPSSLAQAMTEPENEIAPISAPITARIIERSRQLCAATPPRPGAGVRSLSSATPPMAAAEPPPMPLKIATICGMSVMGTFLPQNQNAGHDDGQHHQAEDDLVDVVRTPGDGATSVMAVASTMPSRPARCPCAP
jgi:hypothetical protein